MVSVDHCVQLTLAHIPHINNQMCHSTHNDTFTYVHIKNPAGFGSGVCDWFIAVIKIDELVTLGDTWRDPTLEEHVASFDVLRRGGRLIFG